MGHPKNREARRYARTRASAARKVSRFAKMVRQKGRQMKTWLSPQDRLSGHTTISTPLITKEAEINWTWLEPVAIDTQSARRYIINNRPPKLVEVVEIAIVEVPADELKAIETMVSEGELRLSEALRVLIESLRVERGVGIPV